MKCLHLLLRKKYGREEQSSPRLEGNSLLGSSIVHLMHNLLQTYQWNISCVFSQKSKALAILYLLLSRRLYSMHVLILRKLSEWKNIIEYNGLKSQEEGNFFLIAWSPKKNSYYIFTQFYFNLMYNELSVFKVYKMGWLRQQKHLPTTRETWVWSLGWEDPLEKETTPHSSTLALKIPWAEEPGRLQSMGSQRVGHDWATSLSFTFTFILYWGIAD